MTVMAPRHSFVARLILVVAVVGCLVGMGRPCTALTESGARDSAMPAAMAHGEHSASMAPTGSAATEPSPAKSGPHGHDGHATDCCAAAPGDSLSAVAAPSTSDHVAGPPPAATEAHTVAPAPPQPRPPDLSSLGVQRT